MTTTITLTRDEAIILVGQVLFAEKTKGLHKFRVSTDVDGVKVQVNDGAWTWPIGQPDRTTINNELVLDAIANVLSGHEWSPDTLELVADLVRQSGRDIGDVQVAGG